MNRAIVNFASGDHYRKGQQRLSLNEFARANGTGIWLLHEVLPGWPTHQQKPYAFKAFLLKLAADEGADLIMWCDASILPLRSLEPLWERIERDGYWFSKNGYSNYEWTADSAYPDLFPEFWEFNPHQLEPVINFARELNRRIPHVVATAFGLNLRHPKGAAFLKEYFRLASETRAFCGAWINANSPEGQASSHRGPRCAPCGPPDVRGHRHDQTAASVIAWRLGFELSSPPDPFAYAKFRPDGTFHLEDQDERTILCAHGAY